MVTQPRAEMPRAGRGGGDRSAPGGIALLLTDCDGVLTDGTIYCSTDGEELLRFSRRDGMGVERLRGGRHPDRRSSRASGRPSWPGGPRSSACRSTPACSDKAALLAADPG